ncbi:nucleotide-binding protein [Advenella kashmirensis WT001]|uniref:Nucleotide-binding protein n=1 Tax=Advenella kashmirensis (strain DSM 17095 / LMG 22695 / WT001) TaxID=1036672 RepID=I3UFW1_ADVKW|nr:nucleotide-binding protein [Advenella kashmirensis]AFK63899.1 nucleotide-binding protein [Advenella kashmirensis WT001]
MRKATPSTANQPKISLDEGQLTRGIERLQQRIADLDAVDLHTVQSGTSPELKALERSIEDTLERCFGADTTAAKRYSEAYNLHYHPTVWISGMPDPDYKRITGEKISDAKALLRQAINTLHTDLEDLETAVPVGVPSHSSVAVNAHRVFLVHGHDEAVRETVARFIEKLGIEVIILHEQANSGRTIIEKIEWHSGVGMAVVLLTPDDVGGKTGEDLKPRVRQNVLLELGYFIGVLGRDKVCALKSGNVDIPTDFAGVVWTEMSGEWRTALARELKAAGYEVDWNKVMI